jgi:hypothetical protein
MASGGSTVKSPEHVAAERAGRGEDSVYKPSPTEVNFVDIAAQATSHISLNSPDRMGEHHINSGPPPGYHGWDRAGTSSEFGETP